MSFNHCCSKRKTINEERGGDEKVRGCTRSILIGDCEGFVSSPLREVGETCKVQCDTPSAVIRKSLSSSNRWVEAGEGWCGLGWKMKSREK